MFRVLFLTLLLCPILKAQIDVPLPDYPLDDFSGPRVSNGTTYQLNHDVAIFPWTDGRHGSEFWRSDGTPEGTYMLVDATPGYEWSSILSAAVVGGRFTFSVRISNSETKVFETDGTREGTSLIYEADIADTVYSIGGKVYYTSGSQLIEAIPGGPAIMLTNNAHSLHAAETFLYWLDNNDGQVKATDGSSTWNLGLDSVPEMILGDIFILDTPDLTVLDGREGLLNVLETNLTTSNWVKSGDQYFFLGNDGNETGIWVSDLTAAGTKRLDTGMPWEGHVMDEAMTFGIGAGGVFFFHRGHLIFTDATVEGSRIVVNWRYARNNFEWIPGFGDYGYFRIESYNSIELYQSDGHTITLEKRIYTNVWDSVFTHGTGIGIRTPAEGLDGYLSWDQTSGDFTELTPNYFQPAERAPLGSGLVVLDAEHVLHYINNEGQSQVLKDLGSGWVRGLETTGDHVYVQVGNMVWETDGTPAGTQPLVEAYSVEGFPGQLVAQKGDQVYFRGFVNQDYGSDSFNWLSRLRMIKGNKFYWQDPSSSTIEIYTAGEGFETYDTELNVTGSFYAVGDVLVSRNLVAVDTNTMTTSWLGNFYVQSFIVYEDRGYFYHNGNGGELYETDGHTITLLYRRTEIDDPLPLGYTVKRMNDVVYFLGTEGSSEARILYRLDNGVPTAVAGSAENIASGGPIRNLTVHDGFLYFTAYSADVGDELWRSDGTAEGTQRITDLSPGTASSGISSLTSSGAGLHYHGHDGTTWKTFMVRSPNPAISTPTSLCASGTVQVQAIDVTPGMTYEWSATGAIITHGQGTHQLSFDVTSHTEVRLNLTLTYNGEVRTAEHVIPVVDAAPSATDAIVGATFVCEGDAGVLYEVTPVAGAYGYEWQTPQGTTQLGIDGYRIAVDFGSTNEEIRVRALNGCGEGPWSSLAVTVKDLTPAEAGDDMATCEASLSLAATDPGVDVGTWTILEGTGGSFSDVNLPNATFSGVVGETYLLEWNLDHGNCGASVDTVSITFVQGKEPASAGEDQFTCETSVSLSANLPGGTTGLWEVIDGLAGSFSDPLDPNATFSGLPGEVYTLQWNLDAAPCGMTSDSVTVAFSETVVANAGPDASTMYKDTYGLCANGVGTWTIISGPSLDPTQFTDPHDPYSGFSPDNGPGTYELEWSIDGAGCGDSSDRMLLHATFGTPTPEYVTSFGTDLPENTSAMTIAASFHKGDTLYYLAGAPFVSLYKQENGVTTKLGFLRWGSGYPYFQMVDMGHGLVILDDYIHFFDYATQKLKTLEQFQYESPRKSLLYNGNLYVRTSRFSSSDEFQQVYRYDFNTLTQVFADSDLLTVWRGKLLISSQGQVFAGYGTASSLVSLTPGENYDSIQYLGQNETQIFVAAREGQLTYVLALDGAGSSTTLMSSGFDEAHGMTTHDGRTFFTLGDSTIEGDDQLFRTDGTLGGTMGEAIGIPNPKVFRVFGDRLYIAADNGVWRTNDSKMGIELFHGAGAEAFVEFDGKLMWSSATHIVSTDGTSTSEILKEAPMTLVEASQDHLFLTSGEAIYRSSTPGVLGEMFAGPADRFYLDTYEVYRVGPNVLIEYDQYQLPDEGFYTTDGTVDGFRSLGAPDTNHSIRDVHVRDDLALFSSEHEAFYDDVDLWQTDGTPEGTTLLDSGAYLGDDFLFEKLTTGVLVGFEESGLIRFQSGVKTEFETGRIRGPFKDPHSDAYYYLNGSSELKRTDGTPDVREVVATLDGFTTNPRDSRIEFSRDHIFVIDYRTVWVVPRAGGEILQHGFYASESYESQSAYAIFNEKLVYQDRSNYEEQAMVFLSADGSETRFPIEIDYLARFFIVDDQLVLPMRRNIYVTDGTEMTTYRYGNEFSERMNAVPLGDGLLITEYHVIVPKRLHYLDADGFRPVADIAKNTETRRLQITVGGENQAYILTSDAEKRSALYKLEVGGPVFEDARLRYHIIDNYDTNGDGYLSWSEAAAITALDLSRGDRTRSDGVEGLGVRSLAGIEQLENLSTLYISGNPIEDISPIVAAGLGNDPGDIIDLNGASLGAASCEDLQALSDRVGASGASLSYQTQGGLLEALDPSTWPARSVLELVTGSFTPIYSLDCGD